MKAKKNIIITGFMGTGKTTVGREVARRLGMRFYDTDEIVERRSKMSIAEIFKRLGESRFRETEKRIFSDLLESAEGVVISTGGGTLLDKRIDDSMLASSVLICLYSRVDVIKRRIGADPGRPLAGSGSRLERLLESRDGQYKAMPNRIDTSDRAPGQVAEEIVRIYERRTA